MNTDTFRVTFWGTRGSCPSAHVNYMAYGCNTACVGVEIGDTQFIIDAGTGIKNLSDSAFIKDSKNINILLSHFHNDHTIGLPYFSEMFNKNAVINIHARPLVYESLYELMNAYFRPPFFPIEFMGRQAVATIRFNDLEQSGRLQFQNNIEVEYCSVPHVEGSTSFRISSGDKSLCYMSDVELGASTETFDEYLLAFAENTDLLVLDAFYTGNDAVSGWGHSSWEQGINFAKQAKVKKLAMFHHNINSTDSMLDNCYKKYKNLFNRLEIAKDGLVIHI